MRKRCRPEWTIAERIAHLSQRDPLSGCWLWRAATLPRGYGLVNWRDRLWLAHRLSWTAVHGPIPKGGMICHRCDERRCVNPNRLFLGTRQVNMDDLKAKRLRRSTAADTGRMHIFIRGWSWSAMSFGRTTMSNCWSRRVQKHDAVMSNEELADAYLAEKSMERMRRYVVGGRRFVTLPKDLLIAHWVLAYRDVVSVPEDDRRWDEVLNLQCELELRGIELPMHLVRAEVARFKQQLERLQRESPPDPAAWEQARAELTALRARLQRPKH